MFLNVSDETNNAAFKLWCHVLGENKLSEPVWPCVEIEIPFLNREWTVNQPHSSDQIKPPHPGLTMNQEIEAAWQSEANLTGLS